MIPAPSTRPKAAQEEIDMPTQATKSFTRYLEFDSVLHAWPKFRLIDIPDDMSWDADTHPLGKRFPTWILAFGKARVCYAEMKEGPSFSFTAHDLYRVWFLHDYWSDWLRQRTLNHYRLAVLIKGHLLESTAPQRQRLQVQSLVIEDEPRSFFAYRDQNTGDDPLVGQVYKNHISPYLRRMRDFNRMYR